MNLVDNAWIPVSGMDGKSRLVSLMDVFKEGETIADLSANPCQRIALMRLLICIAQAALDGPADEEDWRQCRSQLPAAAADYLNRWRHRFNLYGDHAFLQVDGLDALDNSLVDKLDFSMASGNNPTLYDHAATPRGRVDSDANLALNLLVYQTFSPGGLIGSVTWAGTETSRSSEHAPCLEGSLLHTLLRCRTLLDTVRRNMLTRVQILAMPSGEWGKPCWELAPVTRDTLKGISASYLGRLVTMPRCIRCNRDSATLTLADGIRYPKFPEYREPSATVRIIKRGGIETQAYLPVNLAKHPWRELGAILSLAGVDQKGGPLVISRLRLLNIAAFDVWTGGLAADKSKLLDMAEWAFSLPSDLLDSLALTAYQKGVLLAEAGSTALRSAIKKYADFVNSDMIWMQNAQQRYWSNLDRRCETLANCVATGAERMKEEWHPVVHAAMRTAYSQTCPHETPRQIEAYAQGWQILKAWKDKKEQD
jgi:CRISPR system Cascade subunit CasA